MRKLLVMLLLVGCGDGAGAEPPAGVRTDSLTTIKYALADATVRDGTYAIFPQGALTSLEVKTQQPGWTRFSYLRFPLDDPPEPAASATLYLYGTFVGSGPPVPVRASTVGDSTWDEGTLTWNNAPARDHVALATAVVSGEPRWYTLDLTAHVRALLESDATQLDLALHSVEYGDALASFASRESPSNAPFLALSSENDNAPPSVAVPAAALPAVVARRCTQLSATGDDDTGEVNLIYTWEVLGSPPAPVHLAQSVENGRLAGACFSAPGSYQFRVTISDSQGLSVTSDVAVEVELSPIFWSVDVEPNAVTLHPGESVQFHATVFDQFENPIVPPPPVYWNIRSSGSTSSSITPTGFYTAGTTLGQEEIVASGVAVFVGRVPVTIAPL